MTSASTLIRMAKKAKTKKEAERLRAAAAKVRREARQRAKGVKDDGGATDPNAFRTATEARLNANQAQQRQANALNAQREAVNFAHNAMQGWHQVPGRGEIVGGAEYDLADKIAKLARKKGGKDEIQNIITNEIARARAEGQRLADRGSRQVREEMIRIHDQQIVCAFLSEIDVHERAGELRPSSAPWTVSALTLTKVAKALREAGYTATGRDAKG